MLPEKVTSLIKEKNFLDLTKRQESEKCDL